MKSDKLLEATKLALQGKLIKESVGYDAGICPNCGSDDLTYDENPVTYTDSIEYYYQCNNCGKKGVELYDLDFVKSETNDLDESKKVTEGWKYQSLKDMANDNDKEIVKYNAILDTDTGIENVFDFSEKNGGAVDSFQYYNDYVLVDKRAEKKTEGRIALGEHYEIKTEAVNKKFNKALIEGLHLDKSKVIEAKNNNNWFGVEGAKYISRGSWSDPQVSYKGYLYNYWDIAEFVYNCMVEDYQEEGKELPAENTKEYDDLFTKYMYDEVPNAFIDLYPQELDSQVMEYLKNGTISSGVVDLIKNASKISAAMTFEGLLERLNSLKELTNISEDKIDEAIKVTQKFADSVDYEDSFDEDEKYNEVLPQIEDILSNMDDLFESKK